MTPCHVPDPSPSETRQAHTASLEHANFYMHQADMLREALLADDKVQTARILMTTVADAKNLPYINPYGRSHADRLLVESHEAEWDFAVECAQKMVTGKRWAKKEIEKDQIAHRKVDVQRLIKTFADQGKFDKIKPLLDVDFSKPLEPQIGYDPDKY